MVASRKLIHSSIIIVMSCVCVEALMKSLKKERAIKGMLPTISLTDSESLAAASAALVRDKEHWVPFWRSSVGG